MPDCDAPAAPTAVATASQTISADEVALYDRQIRLWGMEAQTRMRNAHILLITMRALANEVAKNLVLAGIGCLTVMDSEVVTEEDLGSQFFVSEEHVGKNRAEAAAPAIQQLNPRVPVRVETTPAAGKTAEFFKTFDIVIATELDLDTMLSVNAACRECGRRLYAAATYGLYGFIFADLIEHTFIVKRTKSNMKTEAKQETKTRSIIGTRTTKEGETTFEFVTKRESYVPLSDAVLSKINSDWPLRKKKNVPAVLPGIKALWEFQRLHNRLPQVKKEDFAEFTKLMTNTNRKLGLPEGTVKSGFIRSFVENATTEISPVAAVLGGILAQDAINVLAELEQPIQNILIFDGDTSVSPIIVLAPKDD